MAWAPSYASTEELASFVRIGDTADDAQLGLALATASRAIDQTTNRQFGQAPAPVPRFYPAPRWDRRHLRWIVEVDDLMTASGLAVAYDSAGDQTYATAITDYLLRPLNGATDGRPWTELAVHSGTAFGFGLGFAGTGFADDYSTGAYGMFPVGRLLAPREDALRVTARWGWSGIPDPIRQACLLQASRLLSRRDAPFGVAGSPEAGSEMRLLAKLDVDVSVAVRPFKRVWGAV